jgi:hypothetical protein
LAEPYPGPKTANQTEATEQKYQSTHHAKQLRARFGPEAFCYVRDGKSGMMVWDFAAAEMGENTGPAASNSAGGSLPILQGSGVSAREYT